MISRQEDGCGRLGNYSDCLKHDRENRGQPAGRDGYQKSFQINLSGHADQQRGVFRSQRGGDSRSGQHHTMQNGCVMTAGRDQHEAVPYCVVEGQPPPEVKAGPDGIEHAANSDQNRRLNVYRA